MNGRTQGPWSVSRISKSTKLQDIYVMAGSERIARVVVPYTARHTHEFEMNASLIAASPDLLEACEYAIQALAWIAIKTKDKDVREVLRRLDNAIVKATT